MGRSPSSSGEPASPGAAASQGLTGRVTFYSVIRGFKLTRVLRTFNIRRQILSPSNRQLAVIFMAIVSIVYIASALVNLFEGIPFAMAMYFCVVTVATVGYGDVVLVTPWGRLVAIALIVVSFVWLPLEINKLAQVSRPVIWLARGSLAPRGKWFSQLTFLPLVLHHSYWPSDRGTTRPTGPRPTGIAPSPPFGSCHSEALCVLRRGGAGRVGQAARAAGGAPGADQAQGFSDRVLPPRPPHLQARGRMVPGTARPWIITGITGIIITGISGCLALSLVGVVDGRWCCWIIRIPVRMSSICFTSRCWSIACTS
jgi:hypothetical protein